MTPRQCLILAILTAFGCGVLVMDVARERQEQHRICIETELK